MSNARLPAILLTCITLVTARASAESLTPAPPTQGPWKGRAAGTYVILRVTTAANGKPTSKLERTVLLGTTPDGSAWFSVANAESPDGPWTEAFGHGDGKPEFPIQTTPLGRRALDVAGRKIECDVEQAVQTTDSSVLTTESWTNDDSLVVKQSTVARSRDEDMPPVTTVEWAADGFERRVVDGVESDAVHVRGSTRFGKTTSAFVEVLSARVPGGRWSTKRWAGPDTTVTPTYQTDFVSTGFDAAAAATARLGPGPSTPPRTQAQTLADIVDQAIAHARSPDAGKRAAGVGTLAMNRYADIDRARIIAAVIAGFDDPDAGVRRAAARAAGWNRVPEAARRILAAAAAEPTKEPMRQGEFIRALGDAADPLGLDAVIAAARNPTPIIAEAGFLALIQFTDARAAEVAEDVLHQTEPVRRSICLFRMDRSRMPATVAMLSRFADDTDARTRAAALQCLAARTEPAGVEIALRRRTDDIAEVRRAALGALGTCGWQNPASVVDALADAAASAGTSGERTAAVFGLVNLKDDRAVTFLRQMIVAPAKGDPQDPFAFVPPEVAGFNGLTRVGTRAAADALIELARDPARTDQALRALEQMESSAAARAAWAWVRRPTTDGGPTTQRAARGFSMRDTALQIVARRADRALRDEIDAAIPTAAPAQRPSLRRSVREIDARLAGGRPD